MWTYTKEIAPTVCFLSCFFYCACTCKTSKKNVKLVRKREAGTALLVSSSRENLSLKNVCSHRYTVKVQRELELDECAIHALTEDRKRFLCKAVENYISCLLSGEEHDMWIFRLCSLWLENSRVDRVNEMMKVSVCCCFSLLHFALDYLFFFSFSSCVYRR